MYVYQKLIPYTNPKTKSVFPIPMYLSMIEILSTIRSKVNGVKKLIIIKSNCRICAQSSSNIRHELKGPWNNNLWLSSNTLTYTITPHRYFSVCTSTLYWMSLFIHSIEISRVQLNDGISECSSVLLNLYQHSTKM